MLSRDDHLDVGQARAHESDQRALYPRRRILQFAAALAAGGPLALSGVRPGFAQLAMLSTEVAHYFSYGNAMGATRRLETFDSLLVPSLAGYTGALNRIQQRGLDYTSNALFSHFTSPPAWPDWAGGAWGATHHFPAVDSPNDFAVFPFFNPSVDATGAYSVGLSSGSSNSGADGFQAGELQIASVRNASFLDILFVPFLNGQAIYGLSDLAGYWLRTNQSLRLRLRAEDALTPLVLDQDFDTFTPWSQSYSDWQSFWTAVGKVKFLYVSRAPGKPYGNGQLTTRITDFFDNPRFTWTSPVRWA